MNINLIIAENLKRLRQERNLSLGQLAAASTLSKVMLSQIEKGEANPTINTLWKIATGLNVPYTALLEQQDKKPHIIRKKDIPQQQSPDKAYTLFNYYPNTPERNFELFQMELQEGSFHTSVGHPEKSEEYLLVLEGKLTLKVRLRTFHLEAADAITFSAEGEHTYHNTGSGTLKTIIINYYPR
ncbi:MAG: DNA-binding protein [delta proteobacterium ML8_F1]|nr:MAG: DNA-binding protein [delta proteobacterium ML8_F1]